MFLLLSLLFISVYGSIMDDNAYVGGKNIALFMTVYVIGDILKDREKQLEKVSVYWCFLVWLVFNIVLFFSFILTDGSKMSGYIWKFSFPYSSPLLIVNAVLFFLLFSKIKVRSKLINSIAVSIFSVYIITGNPLIEYLLLFPTLEKIVDSFGCGINTIGIIILFATIVVIASVLVDKIFKPFFNYSIEKLSKMRG